MEASGTATAWVAEASGTATAWVALPQVCDPRALGVLSWSVSLNHRTGHGIHTAQGKMKMWGPSFKNNEKFQDSDSRARDPDAGPFQAKGLVKQDTRP